VLREGSEKIAHRFYNFYYDMTADFEKTFQLIMILGIVFLILAICILIPIVFSVHKTNNKVLSLFGTIPLAEIRELAFKCERYIVNYLEDSNEKKEESFNENEDNAAAKSIITNKK
jgi:hypothetical protein